MQDNVYAKIHLNKPEERFVAQVPHANFKMFKLFVRQGKSKRKSNKSRIKRKVFWQFKHYEK